MDKALAGAGNRAADFTNRIQYNTDRDALNFLLDNMRLPSSAKGKINPNATIAEGYLRSEVTLTSQNTIEFPITVNDGSGRNVTERRLAISQMMLVTQMFIGLYFETDSPTDAIRAAAPLRTYEAIDVNAGTNDVSVVWNGSLSCKVDQVTYFDGMDTKRFYRAGSAQTGVEVSTGATNPAYVADTWDKPAWGFYQLTPFIFFGGQSDNKVELKLPVNINLTDNYATAVFMGRGLLIQNAYANNR